jgi:hypothetical protein
MTGNEDKRRCVALTTTGARCKNRARAGFKTCHIHIAADQEGIIEVSEVITSTDSTASDLTSREQLIHELDDLMNRVREVFPDYNPPPLDTSDRLAGSVSNSGEQGAASQPSSFEKFLGSFSKNVLDPETWRGMWYMANSTLSYQSDLLKRRVKGDYETDEWGLDWEFVESVRPLLDLFYSYFWRIETAGLENIPDYDRTLLVSNHSDQPPWDATIIMSALLNEHSVCFFNRGEVRAGSRFNRQWSKIAGAG